MSDDTPIRLLASSDDPALRALLAAGQGELASEGQVAALATKMGPLLGGGGSGGGTGGGGGAPGAGQGTGKILGRGAAKAAVWASAGVALVVAAASITTAMATRRADRSIPTVPEPASSIAAPARSGEAPVPLPSSSETTPESPPEPVPTSMGAAPHAPTAPPSDSSDEVRLLQHAQDALRENPAEALVLCSEHARRYPAGLLVQEREVIAIAALTKLGRRSDARARAQRFQASFPTSTDIGRIETILGERLGAP